MVAKKNQLSDLENDLNKAKNELAALRKIKTKFELLVNNVDVFVWLLNKNLELTFVSPSVQKATGYTENEFLKTNLLTISTEKSEEIIKNALQARKEGRSDNTTKKWLTQLKHKNGILIWIESTTNPILDENGEFDGVIGVSRNVSTQVALEQKMQENEVNLQAQIDNTTDSIWSIDDSYCIKTLNEPFKMGIKIAFGSDLKPGASILNVLPEPFRSQWKERYDRALKGEHFTVTDHFEFDNLPQYVEVNFNPITFNERVIGVTVFSRDITAQKLSQQKLIESTANLSSTIEHTDARIWSVDNEYNIITINKNFYNDFQIAFNVKLEKGSYALESVPEPLFSLWKKRYDSVLKGETININDALEIKGVPKFIEVSLSPIKTNNSIIGATCYSRDVTKQKTAEKALIESEARYKSLVDNIPSVSYRCLFDKSWTMKFISPEIESLSGFTPDDFIANKERTYASIIHKDDQEYVNLVISEKLENNESFSIEYRIIDKWNNVKWVHERGRGNYNEKSNVEYIDGVISDITLRKKSEQELLRSEQKFRILSDASIDMLSLSSQNEILEYTADVLAKQLHKTAILAYSVNHSKQTAKYVHTAGVDINTHKQIINIIGNEHFTAEIPIDKTILKSLQNDGLIKYPNSFAQFTNNRIDKEAASNMVDFLNLKDIYTIGIIKGNELYGTLNLFSQNDGINENKQFIESFANLTSILLHRQQLIENLHTSEEKFRSMFENTNSSISIQDSQNIYLVNKAWEKITGYTAEEAKTLEPASLVHPNEHDKILNRTKQRLNGENAPTNYIFHLLDKHFNEKWLNISASVITYEGKKANLIIGNDITEGKKADIELNKFSTGIMNSPSSIVITDIDGTIEYVNPYFTEATGYTLEEATGENPKILSSGNNPKEMYTDMWNTILKGEVWNGELQNKNKQGQIYWEAVRIAPIFDDGGIITNFIAIKEDITERKRTLELIEQSEKDLREINAKKDKFFSIIAHDLRSPFSGLAGLVEILKSSYNELSNSEIDRYLDLINQSAQNISKLLENLLSWAKSQTGKIQFNPKQINLLHTINESIETTNVTARNKEINLFIKIEDKLEIFADNNMLNTVLRNLISNAIKYTNRNGQITISSYPKTINKTQYTVICIADNGVGIPADKQDKIFKIEENYSTNGTEKEKGTGLGLILCKEFIERHGGNIWCESEENKGSMFCFTLPVK